MKVAAKLIITAILAFLLILTGCKTRIIDFTVISTKNVYIPWEKRADRKTEGEACKFAFMGIGQPSLKDAVDKAIEAAGLEYNALMDGVVYLKTTYACVGYKFCYIVKGIPIKIQVEKKAEGSNPETWKSEIDDTEGTTVEGSAMQTMKSSGIIPHSRLMNDLNISKSDAYSSLCMTLQGNDKEQCIQNLRQSEGK